MEQRRLRLGDILDDYCPRERRLTNHAVVAMIDDTVKQTRCTTCDAEHVYKGGKVPRRRKKETPAALYKEVLAGMPETEASPVLTVAHPDALDDDSVAPPAAVPPIHLVAPAQPVSTRPPQDEAISHESQADMPGMDEAAEEPLPDVEEGPVHRPLIRAQLPRIEGHKEERRLPEFTIRQ